MKPLVGAIIIGLAVIACDRLTATSPGESCDALLPHILELSERNKHPLRPHILKVSDVGRVSKTSTELVCYGMAKWSDASDLAIRFRWERDADGDEFVYYEQW